MVTFEYEDLGYHCSTGNSLSHLARTCPLARSSSPVNNHTQELSDKRKSQEITSLASRLQATNKEDSFKNRVDRHGNPFGERLSLQEVRGRPLQNKIVPQSRHSREPPQMRQSSASFYRPITQNHETRISNSHRRRSPLRQWREKGQERRDLPVHVDENPKTPYLILGEQEEAHVLLLNATWSSLTSPLHRRSQLQRK